jgi:flagellar biosynthesis chaperone FliJ
MKAFHFRLDQALRWRSTQVEIERARVAMAAGVVRDIQGEIEQRRMALSTGCEQISRDGTLGASLAQWAAFQDRTRREIKALEGKAAEAEKALAAQMQLLTEANRKLQLLENLKQTAKAQWQAGFSRELEAFAGESYLFSLQSKNGRARSSNEVA